MRFLQPEEKATGEGISIPGNPREKQLTRVESGERRCLQSSTPSRWLNKEKKLVGLIWDFFCCGPLGQRLSCRAAGQRGLDTERRAYLTQRGLGIMIKTEAELLLLIGLTWLTYYMTV